jgi:hypothetical protein
MLILKFSPFIVVEMAVSAKITIFFLYQMLHSSMDTYHCFGGSVASIFRVEKNLIIIHKLILNECFFPKILTISIYETKIVSNVTSGYEM